MSIHGDDYQNVKLRARYQIDEIRSKEFLDKVPKADQPRTLSRRGREMSDADRQIFLEKGNKALVSVNDTKICLTVNNRYILQIIPCLLQLISKRTSR